LNDSKHLVIKHYKNTIQKTLTIEKLTIAGSAKKINNFHNKIIILQK